MRRIALFLAILLAFAPVARSDDAAGRALAAAVAASERGDWAAVSDRVAGLSTAGLLDDWRAADSRLLALAGAAEGAGATDALIAVAGRLADLRALALPATDPMVARTHAVAGDLLAGAGRFTEAAGRLARADAAFDALSPPLPAEQASALLRRAEASGGATLPGDAAAALAKAARLFAAAGDPRRTDTARRAGEALRVLGRAAEAAAITGPALEAAHAPDAATARLAQELGEEHVALGDLEAARLAYLRALDAVPADAPGLRLGIVGALAELMAALGDRGGAIALLAPAVAEAGAGATAEGLVARNRLAGLLLEDGRRAEALAAYRAVLDGIEGLGLDGTALVQARASVFTNAARALVDLGRGAEAADLAGRAYAASLLLGTSGDDLVATLLVYAEALAASGDLAGAASRFAEAVALAPVAPDRSTGLLAARDAARFDLFRAGDAVAAAALLRPAVATFVRSTATAERRPEEGAETRSEVARLLVAALWRLAGTGVATGPDGPPRPR